MGKKKLKASDRQRRRFYRAFGQRHTRHYAASVEGSDPVRYTARRTGARAPRPSGK